MNDSNHNGAQPGPWSQDEAWARAWSEMETIAFRAIQGWREMPGAVQVAPLLVGPLLITCRIEAFAPVLPGRLYPEVTWKVCGRTVTRFVAVERIAQQIRRGHLPLEA